MVLHRAMAGLVLRHPTLIPALLALAWASRSEGWYGRFPFLPIPDPAYLSWRMETAYGDPAAVPPAHEAARYLQWTFRMRRRH